MNAVTTPAAAEGGSRPQLGASRLFLPCPRGLEGVLAQEIGEIAERIGSKTLAAAAVVPGGVGARGDWRDLMALNLWSRIASRVLLEVAQGPAADAASLYRLALGQRWDRWLHPRQTLRVDVSELRAAPPPGARAAPAALTAQFATLKLKDAICDQLRERCGARPSVDTAQPDVRVFAHLHAGRATLYVDSSGEALFKRGWRSDARRRGEAPIKENLAAGLVRLMAHHGGWQPGADLLVDPFCGSGTLLIEAAQWACAHAPGLARARPAARAAAGSAAGGGFGFERLPQHAPQAWRALLEQAAAARRRDLDLGRFVGSDIDADLVRQAEANAQRAGVQGLRFAPADARRLARSAERGFVFTNPPYGHRLEARGAEREADAPAAAAAFFAEFGRALKQLAGWQAWIISADLQLPQQLGLAAKRRIPLFNGALEARLFGIPIVAGSYRPRAADERNTAA